MSAHLFQQFCSDGQVVVTKFDKFLVEVLPACAG
jgi:hypothetical protein